MKCGHTFCRRCITGVDVCPLHGAKLSSRIIPNLAILEQIKSLEVYCRYGVRRKEAEKIGEKELEGEEHVVEFEVNPEGRI